jgi:membrane-associated protease RseP (regulator of RpoE activity)
MSQPYSYPVSHNEFDSLPKYYTVADNGDIKPEPEFTTKKVLFHLFLLCATIVTTTLCSALFMNGFSFSFAALANGLLFSFTALMILGTHEFGHYFACRYHGVEATLPYFIPSPFPPVGTFGAVIKIKSRIPSKRALFDIGIAGPLAGFVFLIPAAAVALYFSQAAPIMPSDGVGFSFNDPPLFRAIAKLLGVSTNVFANPIWLAAWFGCLMTSLNLLPVGQLDGGHVVYAVVGRKLHTLIGRAVFVGMILLTAASFYFNGLLVYAVFIIILAVMMRAGHPPVYDEDEPLDLPRKIIALIGLVVFLLCFMPLPISF